jgi:hypothetical protein
VTEKTVENIVPDNNMLYKAMLEKSLPYMAGETDKAPLSPDDLIETELAAIAVGISRESGGETVKLADIKGSEFSYDGSAFAAIYKKQRGQ